MIRSSTVYVFAFSVICLMSSICFLTLSLLTGKFGTSSADLWDEPKVTLKSITRWITENSEMIFAHHCINYEFSEFISSKLLSPENPTSFFFFLSTVGFAGSWEWYEKSFVWVFAMWSFIHQRNCTGPFCFVASALDYCANYIGTGEDQWNPPLADLSQSMLVAIGFIVLIFSFKKTPMGYIFDERKLLSKVVLSVFLGLSMLSSLFLPIQTTYSNGWLIPYGIFICYTFKGFLFSLLYIHDCSIKQDILSKREITQTYMETGVYFLFQVPTVLFLNYIGIVTSNISYFLFIYFLSKSLKVGK